VEAWKHVVERGYEGYVAKDEASVYEGGADEAVAQGEAEGVDGRGRPLAAADLRGGPAMIQCVLVAAECAWAWAQMIEKPQRGT
jgi:hypothetical protein